MSLTLAPPRIHASPDAAWTVLQRSQGLVQKWPEGFRGYRARIRCEAADWSGEGRVAVAGGRDFAIDLELPAFHDAVRARFLAHVDERTPRFFKDGDGRYTVRAEPGPDGERWIRVERPDATVRYRLDSRGRIEVVERLEGERATVTVVEEYARATPGRVLPARRRTIARDRLTEVCLARELLVEAHCRIEHVWLPTRWDVSVETSTDSLACRIELFAHQLL
jgi:hypothetical protein